MKTLVTGALQATAEELDALRQLGLDITVHMDERDAVEHPEQYEAVICNGLFLYQDIASFEKLRYVQLTSAGYDRVPMDYIKAHEIKIHNAAGVYSIPMAEWTIMRMLEFCKNAGVLYQNQQGHLWQKDRTWMELSGKTACIIGFGAYGAETAKRLHAFGVRVTVINRSKKDSPYVDQWGVLEELDRFLSEADFVILAIALVPDTLHLIGQQQFKQMKSSAVLVNAARGRLVDEKALLDALDNGHLAGAILDVFEEEPLPEDSGLYHQKNVLLSSHNSFVGEHCHQRLCSIVKRNMKEMYM